MIILDSTDKSIEILLGGAVTTNELPVVVGYVDISKLKFGYTGVSSGDTQSNGSTAVELMSAPAANVSRQLKFASIFNADTVDATVTVRLNNNSTYRNILTQTLTPGQTLEYIDSVGWKVDALVGTMALQDADDVAITGGTASLTTLETSGGIGMHGESAGAQAAHIADPSGGGTVDSEARTAINSILVVLENLGATASS